MDGALSRMVAVEPSVWFLVFETKPVLRWVSWLAMGHFKHVSALGYVPAVDAWVLYEVNLVRTRVALLPDCDAVWESVRRARESAVTLAITRRPDRRPWLRLGFWCAPAMSHLVGVKTCFRPDRLYRECVRAGAVPVPCGAPDAPLADAAPHGHVEPLLGLVAAPAGDLRGHAATG